MDKMRAKGRRAVVFYGSQTGTAEECANRLAKELRSYGIATITADPLDCEMERLAALSSELPAEAKPLAIFCLATYGEGDPTDNALEFWDLLKEQEETQTLDLVRGGAARRVAAWLGLDGAPPPAGGAELCRVWAREQDV